MVRTLRITRKGEAGDAGDEGRSGADESECSELECNIGPSVGGLRPFLNDPEPLLARWWRVPARAGRADDLGAHVRLVPGAAAGEAGWSTAKSACDRRNSMVWVIFSMEPGEAGDARAMLWSWRPSTFSCLPRAKMVR